MGVGKLREVILSTLVEAEPSGVEDKDVLAVPSTGFGVMVTLLRSVTNRRRAVAPASLCLLADLRKGEGARGNLGVNLRGTSSSEKTRMRWRY